MGPISEMIVRSTMNTSVKIILTAASLAVLASPVMAHSERTHATGHAHTWHGYAPGYYGHAPGYGYEPGYWYEPGYGYAPGYGSAPPMETNNHVRVDDCVRVAFPQCSGGNWSPG
jgi:hypothetical protein